MQCPYCHSHQTRKKVMIYGSRTSVSGDVTMFNKDGELITGRVSVSEMSPIQMAAAPPSAPSAPKQVGAYLGALVGFGIGVYILLTNAFKFPEMLWEVGGLPFICGFLGVFGGIGLYIGYVTYRNQFRKNSQNYKILHERHKDDVNVWLREWMCLDCGKTFIP